MMPMLPASAVRIVRPFLLMRLVKLSDAAVPMDIAAYEPAALSPRFFARRLRAFEVETAFSGS